MDARTLNVVLLVASLVEALVLLVQYRSNKQYRGLGWWAAGGAVLAVAFLASALRGESVPGRMAIVVALILLVAAYVVVYVGVAQFLDRPVRQRWAAVLVSVVAVAATYFVFVDDLVGIRRAVVYLGIAVASVLIAEAAARTQLPAVGRAATFLVGVFLVLAVLYTILAVAELLGADAGKSIYADSPVYVGGLLVGLAANMLWTFGLVFLVNRRLSADIDTERENLQRIFTTSPDATVISRLSDGVIVDVNWGFTQVTGYTRQEALGQSSVAVPLWCHPEERDKVVNELLSAGHCANFEADFRRKDGETITGMLSARLLDLHGEPHVVSITRDITERKRLEEQLKHQASTDSLTGVANRRQFLHDTTREIARSQRHQQSMSVAILDIDHFKDLNDTHGHSAGDEALVAFIALLSLARS